MYKTPLEEFYGKMVAELGKAMAGQIVKSGRILPAVPTQEEVWDLYQHAKTTRDLLILRTFYSSGIRNSELVHLKVADLIPTASELFIREGKFGEDRYVRVDPDTMEMLLEWRKAKKLKPADAVFGLRRYDKIHRIVVSCGVGSGIVGRYRGMGRRFSPHSLRHACRDSQLREWNGPLHSQEAAGPSLPGDHTNLRPPGHEKGERGVPEHP